MVWSSSGRLVYLARADEPGSREGQFAVSSGIAIMIVADPQVQTKSGRPVNVVAMQAIWTGTGGRALPRFATRAEWSGTSGACRPT